MNRVEAILRLARMWTMVGDRPEINILDDIGNGFRASVFPGHGDGVISDYGATPEAALEALYVKVLDTAKVRRQACVLRAEDDLQRAEQLGALIEELSKG